MQILRGFTGLTSIRSEPYCFLFSNRLAFFRSLHPSGDWKYFKTTFMEAVTIRKAMGSQIILGI